MLIDLAESKTNPIGKLGNPEKCNFGFWGGLGIIFIVNLIQRLARKLPIIILLHLGLVTFKFHFGKTQTVSIVMFFGLGGCVHDSQNQHYLSSKHQDAANTYSDVLDMMSKNLDS